MDLEVARDRLLKAIDTLHPNLGLDALRLMDAIDDLVKAHLRRQRQSDSANGESNG